MVGHTLDSISTKLNEPVLFVKQALLSLQTMDSAFAVNEPVSSTHYKFHPLLKASFNDHFDFRFCVRLQFLSLQVICGAIQNLGWINDYGEHMLLIEKKNFGVYDSALAPNVSFFEYSGIYPTTVRTDVNEVRSGYHLMDCPWWRVATQSQPALVWTEVSHSLVFDENVISLTGKLSLSSLVPPTTACAVIQVTMSLQTLSELFSSWNATPNGEALLMDDSLMIIAASSGFRLPNTTEPLSANDTFAATYIAQWLNQTSLSRVPISFKMNDTYVDVSEVKQEGGLILWILMLTPSEDFMSEIISGTGNGVKQAKIWMVGVIGVECVLGFCVLIMGLVFVTLLGRNLRRVLYYLQCVSHGDFEAPTSPTENSYSFVSELFELENQVRLMRNALDVFSKYVPIDAVKHLCRNNMVAEVGVHKKTCTVFFLDVVDFTKMMDEYGVDMVVPILHQLFESFSNILVINKAVIDKYIGDAIMAVWGALEKVEDAEFLACKAALEIKESLKHLNERFDSMYGISIKVRMGIHSGSCLAGNVGCSHRLNFTVLGSNVNLAARLEPLNKEFYTTTCVSTTVRECCKDRLLFRALGHVLVRGLHRPVLVHELLGSANTVTNSIQDFQPIDQALLSGKKIPQEALENYTSSHPTDKVVKRMLKLYRDGKIY
ncbi:Adenylate cyclase, class 3 [Pelomyxa schiedti]|nr:Adenylate cyclase, class 3 [Pelomyxa schiedti]